MISRSVDVQNKFLETAFGNPEKITEINDVYENNIDDWFKNLWMDSHGGMLNKFSTYLAWTEMIENQCIIIPFGNKGIPRLDKYSDENKTLLESMNLFSDMCVVSHMWGSDGSVKLIGQRDGIRFTFHNSENDFERVKVSDVSMSLEIGTCSVLKGYQEYMNRRRNLLRWDYKGEMVGFVFP